MRRLGLLWLVLLGCSTAPPAASPVPLAQPAEPRLGATAAAIPVEPEPEPAPQPQPAAVLPRPDDATLVPPPQFEVEVETTVGNFVVLVTTAQAPHGAQRFYNLAAFDYFSNATFFRAIAGFVVQFGIHGNPEVNGLWGQATIEDDPVVTPNVRGTVSFAKSAIPNSATTQLFINLSDNPQLDAMGFAPLGRVTEGMDVVDQIYTGYGEGGRAGKGPSQTRIITEGEGHLRDFPLLTRIVSMRVR